MSPEGAAVLSPCLSFHADVAEATSRKPGGVLAYLLKFTMPFGIPVGVLKAGRSFSPSLMAFIRNTWKGQRAL